MKKLVILLAFIFLGACGNQSNEFSEDLYWDTRDLNSDLFIAASYEEQIPEETANKFDLYEEKYVKLNSREKEIHSLLISARGNLESHFSGEAHLASEDDFKSKYFRYSRELGEKMEEINEEFNYYTEEHRKREQERIDELFEEMDEEWD